MVPRAPVINTVNSKKKLGKSNILFFSVIYMSIGILVYEVSRRNDIRGILGENDK